VAPAGVHRFRVRRGRSRLRDLDPPTGEQLRDALHPTASFMDQGGLLSPDVIGRLADLVDVSCSLARCRTTHEP
jgi:hypothetical protein